jgi:mono/diheme cytochrome c family protein
VRSSSLPALSVALLLAACGGAADPRNAQQVALGAKVYTQHGASCHGA